MQFNLSMLQLAMPGHNGVIKKNGKQLNITNNLRIIPSVDGDVELGVSYLFDTPVYWQLPVQFLGDKVRLFPEVKIVVIFCLFTYWMYYLQNLICLRFYLMVDI